MAGVAAGERLLDHCECQWFQAHFNFESVQLCPRVQLRPRGPRCVGPMRQRTRHPVHMGSLHIHEMSVCVEASSSSALAHPGRLDQLAPSRSYFFCVRCRT